MLDKSSPTGSRMPMTLKGVQMHIFAAVDCHKSTHTVVFIDALVSELKAEAIANDASGFQNALGVAQELGDNVIWVLESAGG